MRLVFFAACFIGIAALGKGNYADWDNRDTQKLDVEDDRAALAVHELEAKARLVRRDNLKAAVGSVSEATLREIEHEIQTDPLQTAMLAAKVRMTESKFVAYDTFIAGKKRASLEADVVTNRASVAIYEAELAKATLDVAYLRDRHVRLKGLNETGTVSGAEVLQAALEIEKRQVQQECARRKLAEQTRQLVEAEAELKNSGSIR